MKVIGSSERIFHSSGSRDENADLDENSRTTATGSTPQEPGTGAQTESYQGDGHEQQGHTQQQVVPTSKVGADEKTIRCAYCSYQTNRKNHLNEHTRIIHLRMKTVCDLCGKGRSLKKNTVVSDKQ
jgi:hypothetical protein